ncbi:recombinase family protein [Terrisporobacter sp.]|uniref:recombinase family protein n=1 Tax=Terrisporobacter sp. TaxID=1965305 RepID=UPI0026398F92|nr:recombinase family protein [Terrisporobacter sp.]
MSKRVAIYCRVSTIEQAQEGYSVDEQRRRCIEYCEKEGHEVFKVYEDRGISGKNISGRPGLKDLLKDANAGKFDLVIVWKLNRISRRLIDILNIVDTLDKNKIAFRSLTESFETETPAGKLQLNIMGAIGEFERGTIAENVKMGMMARAKEGKWNGGKVLGYDIVEIPSEGKRRKETKLVINEKEAMTVRRIFELYSTGHGYKATVNRVNQEGHRSKKGNPFATATIKEILKNPVYIGKIRYNLRQDWNEKRRKNINPNPILVDGEHEAIIDNETWEKVQIILKDRSKTHNRVYDSEFPLTGLLKCPVCGASMTIGRSYHKRKDGTRKVAEYYVCGNWKNKGTAVCNSNSIRAEVADGVVTNKIIETVNNELLLKKVINNINKNKSSKLKPKLDEMNVVNKEIDRLSGKKNSSIELFEDGILTKSELAERIKKLNEEIDTLKFRLDELKQDVMLAEGEPVPFELVSQVMNKFGEIFKESSTRQQRKQLLNLLVSKITIDKSRNIDSIELQINKDVIRYLMKEESSKKDGSSFFHASMLNCTTLKFVI